MDLDISTSVHTCMLVLRMCYGVFRDLKLEKTPFERPLSSRRRSTHLRCESQGFRAPKAQAAHAIPSAFTAGQCQAKATAFSM